MSHLRILLIEDEAVISDLYERMLGRLISAFPGATVSRVESLEDAREILKGLAPDVAVLDLNLKDAGDETTVAEIKVIAARCPVVVVTGLTDPSLRARCMEMGAHSFFRKTELGLVDGILERAVIAAMDWFKTKKREGLSREIEALRNFAIKHGPET